jgi:acyl-CoA synthetase (AMP-forming)/AMP-acid ligase II
VLREAAARAVDNTALIEGAPDRQLRRRWTYGELLQEAECTAQALLGRFQPGDRVAVWANNIPEWVVLEIGAALAGVILVTINPAYRKREVSYVLKQSRAQGIFLVPAYRGNPMASTVEELRGELPELRDVILFSDWSSFCASGSPTQPLPEVRPTDPVQIQYTSGTTGFPKGAVLHHRGLTNNARLTAQGWGAVERDVWVNPMPMFHTGGCAILTLGALQSDAAQVLMPYFDPALQLELVESERATLLFGVPTMLIGMLEHSDFTTRDLSSVRVAASGGATVLPEVVHHIETSLGVPFSIVFGQTESSPVITQVRLDDSDEDRATSLGRALPQTEVKIIDPGTGDIVLPNTVGELCTRGYLVMQGYFENAEATAAAIDRDGWLHTGDLGSMDERGFCRIAGRLKEMIIRGGENIYPREIEQLLFTHPTVADAAVVGVPDHKWGEQVAAFIRPAAGHTPTEQELRAFCREHLSPHKTPVYWQFVSAFPLTASGKVQKFLLRDQFLADTRTG